MIAEIPAPDCTGSQSPWLGRIADSRAAFDARFSSTDRYQQTTTEVTITGVGYFDRTHGQRGVATNGVELHPVLALTFR